MEKIRKISLLSFLVVVVMLASSFTIMGVASGAEEPTANVRAIGDGEKILYIYGDKAQTDEWEEFLTDMGYAVDFLPYDHLKNAEFTNYNLIILGKSHRLQSEEVRGIYRSHKPIIGLGYAGAYAYIAITGKTTFYGDRNTTNLHVKNTLLVYSEPNSLISSAPNNLTLYSSGADRIYLALTSNIPYNESFYIGAWEVNENYTPIAQINNFLFYGYNQSISQATSTGSQFMENLIRYMIQPKDTHYFSVGIPRVRNRIILDGSMGFFEWWGARFISFDDDSENYTAMFEDESNLYIFTSIANVSTSPKFITLWFERNNSRESGVNTSAFYIIASTTSGVKYREVESPNTWSSFKDPDGVRIEANISYKSSVITSEWRISKSYLNITLGSGNMMGFGVQYSCDESNLIINYPSSFSWQDASTAMTIYSDNHWKGQLEYLNSPYWDKITVDGAYDSNEWAGSNAYYIPTLYSHYFTVKVAHDNDNLYIGGYFTNISGEASAVYFYFDTESNGGTAPQTDDFEIFGGKSTTDSFYMHENDGTGSGWSYSAVLKNASMNFSMKGSYVYFELNISFSKLGITPGEFKSIRMGVATLIGSTTIDRYRVPTTLDHNTPDTWTIRLYPQSVWGTDERAYDARAGKPVTIDGKFSQDEWSDAFYTYYPTDMDYYAKIYIKTDTTNNELLIAFTITNVIDSNNTFLEVGFDVGYDRSYTPRDGDVALHITYWNYSLEYQGNSSTHFWSQVSSSGWRYATDNTTSTWSVEIAISYEKLGIIPNSDYMLGVLFYFSNNYSNDRFVPMSGSFFNLSRWNTITSSDSWGETTIPELNAGAVIMVAMMVPIIAVAWRRKH